MAGNADNPIINGLRADDSSVVDERGPLRSWVKAAIHILKREFPQLRPMHDDIVREAVIKLWDARGKIETESDRGVRRWFLTVVENNARGHLRRSECPTQLPLNYFHEPHGACEGVQVGRHSNKRKRVIADVLKRRPPVDSAIYEAFLCSCEGDSWEKELATLLHVEPNCIHVRWYRLRDAIKKALVENDLGPQCDNSGRRPLHRNPA